MFWIQEDLNKTNTLFYIYIYMQAYTYMYKMYILYSGFQQQFIEMFYLASCNC